MSDLTNEQRAHDLALLTVQFEFENLLNNGSGEVDFDVLEKYIQYYNDAVTNLPKYLG